MELPVIVKNVVFKNANGFAVMGCDIDRFSPKYTLALEDKVKEYINPKYKTFTITTGMLDINEDPKGGQYVFVGEFISDKKFGKQFKSEFYFQDVPTTEDGLQAFLMTLPNIKEARSAAIIDKFGVEGVINILDNDISRLTEIAGINEKRLPPIKKEWDDKKCLRQLYTFLLSHGIAAGIADKTFKQWGKAALKTITENPYRLSEIRGIGFLTADGIAHKICKTISENERITYCIQFVLEECLYKQSDLCIPYGSLKKAVLSILTDCNNQLNKSTDNQLYLKLIPECLKSNLDKFTLVKDLETQESFVYLEYVWEKEYYIAKSLRDRKDYNHAMKDCTDEDVNRSEKNVSKFNHRNVVLDDCQKEAIRSAFEHKISIITGPGGSGKSTICRCIYAIAMEKGLKVRMMSPTGKAAQVLFSKTDCPTSTIHRGLKLKPGDDYPNEDIKEDILLIDEISMAGLDTMFAIMAAMEENLWGNIIFVGDKNQLPSVSPGNFLSDIIESGCAHVVTLDKIHRQDENSFISLLANEISKGKVVTVPDNAIDIKWHDLHISSFHQDVLDFVSNYLDKGNNIEDLQVISPMKKGDSGVYKLNEIMQKKMSEINGTVDKNIQIGFNKFHVGDRVIQIENDYDKMIFNGDMGIVKDLGEKVVDPAVSDKKVRFITVEFYGENLDYYGEEIEALQLAWCITVHKFQGSQSKNVLLIMANEQQIMMSKELVYTAFTRAEKQLDIFGSENMLRLAPTRSIIRKRFTNLRRILEELHSNKKILQVLKKEHVEK